jgi:hypothetical protein
MKPREVRVSLRIPAIGEVSGTWEPNEKEAEAAWEMYVELVTRVAVVPLPGDEGLLRETLSSLYQLFDITRDILRRYGPTVAQPKRGRNLSFGKIAVAILNGVLRRLLTTWHPRLQAYELIRAADVSIADHERKWEHAPALRADLEETRGVLRDYARYLAIVTDVPDLVWESSPPAGNAT